MNNCFILIDGGDGEIIGIVKSQFHAAELMSALEYDNKVGDAQSFTLIPTYHSAFDDKEQA
jgi:hypothetical protein